MAGFDACDHISYSCSTHADQTESDKARCLCLCVSVRRCLSHCLSVCLPLYAFGDTRTPKDQTSLMTLNKRLSRLSGAAQRKASSPRCDR
eukprot:m.592373 g.592373  ORF g.592373 m.592373 type:complete len:90 (-) comp58021_c0_seq22:3828-4097(-)